MKNILFIFIFLTLSAVSLGYEILGLGSPCIDYILPVADEDLKKLHLIKGGRLDLKPQELNSLVEGNHGKMMFTGDCTSNTIKGLAALGMSCALTGNVGNDGAGDYIRQTLAQLRITPLFTETATATSQIACLVTPDGQRSFCTCIQAEREISEKILSQAIFSGVQLVHMEGYNLENGTYMEKAMQMAKAAGAIVSLDLADSGLIKRFRQRIFALLEEYTDVLFLNQQESYALTHLPPDKSAFFLKNFCSVVVVKIGDQGCWVCSDEGLFHSPAIEATVVDTTGAGDLFASAFLYGYLNHHTLKACAYFGNLAGSAAVAKYGPELPATKWDEIRQVIHNYQN